MKWAESSGLGDCARTTPGNGRTPPGMSSPVTKVTGKRRKRWKYFVALRIQNSPESRRVGPTQVFTAMWVEQPLQIYSRAAYVLPRFTHKMKLSSQVIHPNIFSSTRAPFWPFCAFPSPPRPCGWLDFYFYGIFAHNNLFLLRYSLTII